MGTPVPLKLRSAVCAPQLWTSRVSAPRPRLGASSPAARGARSELGAEGKVGQPMRIQGEMPSANEKGARGTRAGLLWVDPGRVCALGQGRRSRRAGCRRPPAWQIRTQGLERAGGRGGEGGEHTWSWPARRANRDSGLYRRPPTKHLIPCLVIKRDPRLTGGQWVRISEAAERAP